MEMIYYTIAAIVLYGVSDYILNTIEIRMGKRLPNRSFIFLVIILVLSLTSFSVIRALLEKPKSAQQTTNQPLQGQVQPKSKQTK